MARFSARQRRQGKARHGFYVVEFADGTRLCANHPALLKRCVRRLPCPLLDLITAYYYTWERVL